MKTQIVLAACAAVLASTPFVQAGEMDSVFIAAEDVQFEDIIPEVVAFATVTGDRETGPHGTFVRIPAGAATPMHTHSTAYHAVIIQGVFENPIAGDEASEESLGPGSYYFVPASADHVSRCAASSPTDCLTYFHQTTPFDFAVSE